MTTSCPTCGSKELHPDGDKILIRAFKVCDAKGRWWSQCLVCSGYYGRGLVVNGNHHSASGWFCEDHPT